MIFFEIIFNLNQIVTAWFPNPGMNSEQSSALRQIGEGFQMGRTDPRHVLLGIVTMLLILGGIAGIIWLLNQYRKKKEKKLTILEAYQNNYRLSDGQQQYLEALIERFKNNYVHNPEVATSYLKQFLEYSVKNLTHAPSQTLRRQVHKIPNIEPDEEILVILGDNEKFETLTTTVLRQKDRYLTIPTSPEVENLDLNEGQSVEISSQQGHLHYRGRGKIQAVTEEETIFHVPDGMHFDQQRVYTRVSVDDDDIEAKLCVQCPDDETIAISAELKDISVEGARLLADKSAAEISKHNQGTLEFELPDSDIISVRIEVVRAQKENGKIDLGLKFTNLSLDTREHISRFVKQKTEEES